MSMELSYFSEWSVQFNELKQGRFIGGLCDGTLPLCVFERFCVSDRFYLEALLAFYAEAQFWVGVFDGGEAFFSELYKGTVEIIEQLEGEFLADVTEAHTVMEAFSGYVGHLNAVLERQNPYELVGAAAPCILLYWHLYEGLELEAGSPEKYRLWVESNRGDEVHKLANTFIKYLKECEQSGTYADLARAAFDASFGYELQIFKDLDVLVAGG